MKTITNEAVIAARLLVAAFVVLSAEVTTTNTSFGSHQMVLAADSTATPTAGPGPTIAPTPTSLPIPPTGSPLSSRGFFPTRPKGVKTFSISGTLTSYAYGMDLGGFGLMLSNGSTMNFVAPLIVKINGTSIHCREAPYGGAKPDDTCSDWPPTLIVGTTLVTATYWNTVIPNGGPATTASDMITY